MPDPTTPAVLDVLGQYLSHRRRSNLARSSNYKPDAVWDVLKNNRLCNIAKPLSRCLESAPDDYRELTWSLNSSVLVTILRVSKIFRTARIQHAFIKGPLATREAFGEFFFRPSTDVDILVPPRDFNRADALLVADGFKVDAGSRSLYWRSFLGEQHFEPPDHSLSTVDLHKAIYHPACQRKLVDTVVNSAETKSLADQMISVPDPVCAILITVTYIVKGLMKREASGHHLLEVALLLEQLGSDQQHQLEMTARLHGLTKALGLVLAAVASLKSRAGAASELDCRQRPSLAAEKILHHVVCPMSSPKINRLQCLVASGDSYHAIARMLAWETGRKLAQKAFHLRLF